MGEWIDPIAEARAIGGIHVQIKDVRTVGPVAGVSDCFLVMSHILQVITYVVVQFGRRWGAVQADANCQQPESLNIATETTNVHDKVNLQEIPGGLALMPLCKQEEEKPSRKQIKPCIHISSCFFLLLAFLKTSVSHLGLSKFVGYASTIESSHYDKGYDKVILQIESSHYDKGYDKVILQIESSHYDKGYDKVILQIESSHYDKGL
ncbi:hypothetical protein llap_6076 [Limosa lapponica baueri]|uniref:Uncharacterized protein n=1 Tax=Limosa lapponica baueri TaxID=1758121 RepID=A0A2I0UC24_LIMLA|nr:hypothetical protein llap_6076 [Limosa lapponica baueri]